MVVFRVMATGFPSKSGGAGGASAVPGAANGASPGPGLRGWKPILRVSINGMRLTDLFLQHVEGCPDVFAVKSVCPCRATITLQLGMLKKKSRGKTSWRMDVRIHQDVLTEDCFILTKWDKDAQKVNTLPGMQQMMFLNQTMNMSQEIVRSTHLGEFDATQMALNINDDLCVIPMPLDETTSRSVEMRRANKEGLSKCEDPGAPYTNRTMVFPNHDVILFNSWKRDSVCVTRVSTSILYLRQPSLLPRVRSLPSLSLSSSSLPLDDSDSVIDLSQLFQEPRQSERRRLRWRGRLGARSRRGARGERDFREIARRLVGAFGAIGEQLRSCVSAVPKMTTQSASGHQI